jgi:RNA polymerase sigma-70 factor (ECF subfamily)
LQPTLGNIAEQLARTGETRYEVGPGIFMPEGSEEMTSEPMISAFQEKPDSTLVAATKNGESQAFGFLVKRHEAKAFRIAFRITRNREDAQDVVQESFLKAFTHLDRFQEKSSFSTWLTRIAINEGLMSLRRTRVAREVSVDDMKSSTEDLFPLEAPDRRKSPGEIYEQLETELILCEAMNQLSAESRTILRLQLEERTAREIAEILGLGISTLKSRLFRARRKLHVLLTAGPELESGRAITATRRSRDCGVNSHALEKRMRSRASLTARSKARPAAAVAWPKVVRKRTSESTESRMLDVA